MKRFLKYMVLLSALALGACGFIDTGTVGVRTQQGQIQPKVEHAGFYTNFLGSLDEYTIKETTVDFEKLTPRAKDNLRLESLGVTVYYTANGDMLPDFQAKHAGQSLQLSGDSFIRPGYVLIHNVGSGVINDAVSHFDSLTMHQNRTGLELEIKTNLQAALNIEEPGMFQVTRVIVTDLHTDPSIEASIRQAIMTQKQVETATQLVQVKKQEALANEQVAQSLSPAYLQHEYNQALIECAKNEHCTMIVGSNGNAQIQLKAN
jgi:hypothetical protein